MNVGLGTLEDSLALIHDYEGWIRDQTDDFMDALASRFVWEAPQTADYYLSVRSEVREGTGSYTLTVDLTDITDDHADVKEGATPITVGGAVDRVVDYGGDADFFSFRAEAGRFYEIYAKPSTLGSVWVSLSDFRQRLEYESSRADSQVARLYWEAPESRDYYVSTGSTERVDTGSYTLTVALSGITDDHGNDKKNATLVTVGEAVEGSVDYPGDSDYFSFHAEAGQIYYTDILLGTLAESDMVLYSSEGQVAEGNTGWPPSMPSRTAWKATVTGIHHVGLWGHARNTGTYMLTVLHSGINDDHSDSTPDATHMTVGEAIEGALDYIGDPDFFLFPAQSGTTYSIDLTLGTVWSAVVTLFDSEGQELARDDGTRKRSNGTVTITVP